MTDQVEGADLPEGEDNQRPEWLPENFDSPEALARSYSEAQRKITELAQEKKGLEESITTLSQQFEEWTAQQSRPDPNQVYSQWEELIANDPVTAQFQIAQTVAQQTVQEILKQQQAPQQQFSMEDLTEFAAERVAREHPDFQELRPLIAEELSQNPLFNREDLYANLQTTAQAFETAYNLVKARQYASGADLAQQQLADTRAMKLAAQSAAGTSGRTPSPDDYQQRWQEIMNAPSDRLGL